MGHPAYNDILNCEDANVITKEYVDLKRAQKQIESSKNRVDITIQRFKGLGYQVGFIENSNLNDLNNLIQNNKQRINFEYNGNPLHMNNTEQGVTMLLIKELDTGKDTSIFKEIAITSDLALGNTTCNNISTEKGGIAVTDWNEKLKDVEIAYGIVEKLFLIIMSAIATLLFVGTTLISKPAQVMLLIFSISVIIFLKYDLKKWRGEYK